MTYFTSPGFTNEQVHGFEATGLTDHAVVTEENEHIEVITHPLSDLDALIDDVHDAGKVGASDELNVTLHREERCGWAANSAGNGRRRGFAHPTVRVPRA